MLTRSLPLLSPFGLHSRANAVCPEASQPPVLCSNPTVQSALRLPLKKKPALGLGLGVGLLGTVALAVRYRMQRAMRQPIPETISPAIFATRVVPTSVGEIVYHVSGSGEPIIFIHGTYLGASSFEWSRVYPDFAANHTVIAPDLIGFGESERPAPGLDADDHALALAELIRELLPGRRPTLVASGVGAAVALKLAVQHPELPRQLILYAPVGLDATLRRLPMGIATLARIPGLNAFVYKNYFARRPFIQSWLQKVGFADPTLPADDIVDLLTTCAAQYGAEHALVAFLRGRVLYDVRTQLTRVATPVTVLWPDLPDRFPTDFPETLRAAIPRCEIVPADPLGALGALENPAHLRELIESRLSGSTPGTAALSN